MGIDRFTIEVRPPFRLDLTVWALRRRPHNTIDAWDGTSYTRTLVSGGVALQVAVRQEQGRGARLVVEVRRRGRRPPEAAVEDTRRALERMLGVHVDLSGFYELAAADDRLAALALRFRGMRPPRFPSVFEALVNAVACQQRSLDVGIHLLDRLAAAYGPRVALDDAEAGFPVAEHLAEGDDVGARNSLRRRFDLPSSAGYDEVAAMAERWRPYGGLVYFHLLLDGLARSGRLGEAAGVGGRAGREVA